MPSRQAFRDKMMTFDALRLTLWLKKASIQGANDAQSGYLNSYAIFAFCVVFG